MLEDDETRTVTVSTAGASVRKEGEALVVAPPPDRDGNPQGKPMRIAKGFDRRSRHHRGQ